MVWDIFRLISVVRAERSTVEVVFTVRCVICVPVSVRLLYTAIVVPVLLPAGGENYYSVNRDGTVINRCEVRDTKKAVSIGGETVSKRVENIIQTSTKTEKN